MCWFIRYFSKKRTYLISSGTKASHTHIMQSPCPFLCPHSYIQDKDKEKQYVGTSTQTSGKIPHLPEEQLRQVKIDTLKHVETNTTNICVGSSATSSKASVSHIIRVESKGISYHAFPFSFLCPGSYLQDREKESDQSEPEIKRPIWDWLLRTFCLIAYLALLSSGHLQQLLELGLKTPPSQNIWHSVGSLH